MHSINDSAKVSLASTIQAKIDGKQPTYIWQGHLGTLFGQWIEAGVEEHIAHNFTLRQCDAWLAGQGDIPERSMILPIADDTILELMLRGGTDNRPADGRPPELDTAGILDLGCQFGQRRQVGISEAQAFYDCGLWLEMYWPQGQLPWPPPPKPVGYVRQLQGEVLPMGRSFRDATGPRIVHGCSDFGGLIKLHENRDAYLAQLDTMAAHQQYVRVAWRLNGWLWTDSGLTVDPIRDHWYEDALYDYLHECQQRGIKVNLSSFDMNNWSSHDMETWFRRTAEIAKAFGPDLVWLSGCTNEMRGTWAPGESDENIARGYELMQLWRAVFPHGCWAISDPWSQDKAGMSALKGNVALIHNVRWSHEDAMRRCFNTPYENYPGVPVVEDEPTGPNGSPPHNAFTRHVYQPTDDPDEIFALYTMHVISGMASTYFNDPALVSREPLDSTWGYKELPELWSKLQIPQDIGQGVQQHGGTGHGLFQVQGSHASRADSMSCGQYHIGCISGEWDGQPWAVKANKDGEYTVCYADGIAWQGRLSHGQVVPTPRGFTPCVVRCTQ